MAMDQGVPPLLTQRGHTRLCGPVPVVCGLWSVVREVPGTVRLALPAVQGLRTGVTEAVPRAPCAWRRPCAPGVFVCLAVSVRASVRRASGTRYDFAAATGVPGTLSDGSVPPHRGGHLH